MSKIQNLFIIQKWSIAILSALLVGVYACNQSGSQATVQVVPELVDFNFHVKPILSDRCFACHGPDENSREADLRLDTQEGAFAALGELKDQYAIIPGDPHNSLLVQRINHQDPEEMMPPPESNLSLSDIEIKILERWIEQGAQWKDHWSFITPVRPTPPQNEGSEWAKDPIDQFVLAKMQEQDLKPSVQADKETLIRRLSLDLTGLPAEISEVDAFLNDESEDALEKVIDRLISSEDFAERMAVEWLDVARYADTNGYQDDLYRTMWPWRDWVIKAFDDNMPIDEFIQWQIAGDMFDEASYQQILATAFNRNHMITQEGGVIDEEYRVEYVADRTNTTGRAFLGLTMECARCHDHKYDPVSTKEYYSLFAFYNNIPEKGQVAYNGIAAPSLKIPDEEVKKIRAMLNQDIETQQQFLQTRSQKIDQDLSGAIDQLKRILTPSASSGVEPELYYSFDDLDRLSKGLQENGSLQSRSGRFGKGMVPTEDSYLESNDFQGITAGAFSMGIWVYPSPKYQTGALAAKMENGINGRGYKGFDIFMIEGKVAVHLINNWPFNAIKVVTEKPIQFLSWSHIAFSYDGSGSASGLKIYVNGNQQPVQVETDNLTGAISNNEPLRIGRRNTQGGGLYQCTLDGFSSYRQVVPGSEMFQFNPVSTVLNKDPNKWSHGDSTTVINHYLYHFDDAYGESLQRINNLKEREYMLNDPEAMEVLVMKEMDTVRPAYVLVRGGYDNHGERVEPGTPQSVMEFPSDLPRNRLGLAQWLVSKDNPLTARVFVNRYWQMLFGRGLVATPDDFGNQGELPSHPQLLDWLAVEFMESGWDLKRFIKMLVMTSTYQQSSAVDQQDYIKDPNNVWLARGARFRLTAEMLRDQALSVSGLLVKKVGGPPVKPYQPEGLWAEQTSGGGYTKYVSGKGEDLYRKSLYTYWKRTVPPPSMMTFDASERNLCTVKRQSTSTPLQALVLLNDPQFVEPCRVLAERIIKSGKSDVDQQISWAFRKILSRPPTAEELEILLEVYNSEHTDFKAQPQEAEKLLETGEYPRDQNVDQAQAAALTVTISTILNLSETITKG